MCHLSFLSDKPFTEDVIMEALSELKSWEKFFYIVTGKLIYEDNPDFSDTLKERRRSLKEFMRSRPGKISWKDLAEAAYICGEEETLVKLSQYMKSPEGELMAVMTLDLNVYQPVVLYRSHTVIPCSRGTDRKQWIDEDTLCRTKC